MNNETGSGETGNDQPGRDGGDARSQQERGSGWSRGLGVLSALRDALEQSIAEARERGDLSPDRARELFDAAAVRARNLTSEARERLDFVPRAEFDALARRVAELEARLDGWQDAPRNAPREADDGE